MIPSLLARISSKFSRPSMFSIFAMIRMFSPRGCSISRTYTRSSPFLAKDTEMKSTPISKPTEIISSSSEEIISKQACHALNMSLIHTFLGDRGKIDLNSWHTNVFPITQLCVVLYFHDNPVSNDRHYFRKDLVLMD